jgi:membrane protein DedA with SNARE-associated domain
VLSLDSIINFYSSFGYLSVFGMLLLCGFGVPIPEDISIIAGGIIAGLGYGNIHIMCVVSFFGVMIGDVIVYNIGRIFGRKVFDRKIGKKLIEHGWYDRIIKSFNQNGKMVLFAARFMPGLRTPIFLTAGVTKFVGLPTFILIDGFAALISVPVWNYLGYYGSSNRELLLKWIKETKIAIFFILLITIIAYIAVKIIKNKLMKSKIIDIDIEEA